MFLSDGDMCHAGSRKKYAAEDNLLLKTQPSIKKPFFFLPQVASQTCSQPRDHTLTVAYGIEIRQWLKLLAFLGYLHFIRN